jgi:hypothetical protein
MITLTREEAQNLLAALEELNRLSIGKDAICLPAEIDDAMEILEARLSAPEPEPLEYWNAVEGWVKLDEVRQHFDSVGCGTIYKKPGEGRQPIYTAPPQREWQGLTDEEAIDIEQWSPDVRWAIIRTGAKLKEKNT